MCVVALSCKNSGTGGLPIPKDAMVVIHINTSSLTSKLSWKEIKETNWFQDAQKEANDSFTKKILENPENSGIDVKSDFAYFLKKQGRGGYMVFEGKIKDAALFETALKNMNKDATTQKDGDLSYMETGGKTVVCWNSSQFFALSDAPLSGMNPFARGYNSEPAPSFGSDSLRKFTKDLLNLKNDDNIDKDDRFASMVKDGGDVHFWLNGDQFMNLMGGGMMSMFKFGSLLQGNASAITLSFDAGKITVKSKSYAGEEMRKLMEKYKPANIDAALINRIPSQDVAGVLAFNMDPNTIREILKATGFDGMANAYLSQVNYSVDELINATGGKFLLAFTDLHAKTTADTNDLGGMSQREDPDVNILFASSVHDRPSFEKLINIFREKMGNQPLPASVNFRVTNDWFAYSNHPAPVDEFLNGTSSYKQPFTDKITGHPMGGYVDLQRIFKAAHMTRLDNAADSATYNASVAMWQDAVMTGGEYSGGTSTSIFTINLVDKNTNSLKQLNQYAEKLNAAQKMRKKMYDMEIPPVEQLDTSTSAPATVAPSSN